MNQDTSAHRDSQGAHATTVLDPSTNNLIVLNTYLVEPAKSEELYDLLLRATEEVLRFVPGFLSANLHVSKDRTELVNYAQWRDAASLNAAREDPKVRERVGEAAKVAKSFSPVLYDLRVCLPAATKS